MRKQNGSATLHMVQQPGPQAAYSAADDDAFSVDGWKPLLPEQWFEAKYVGHETALVFNSPKLFMHFEIVEPGEHIGTRLFRVFRTRKLLGRPSRGGKFVAHSNGSLYHVLAKLLDVRLRADRITFQPLRSMLFRVKTRTVVTNWEKLEIPEHARYSVIDEIERQQ